MKYHFLLVSVCVLQSTGFCQSKFNLQIKDPEAVKLQAEVAAESIALLNEIINSAAFRDSVLTRRFDWEDLDAGALSKMSPEAVFNKLYQENLNPVIDFRIAKRSRFPTYWFGSSVGFTDDEATYTFTDFFHKSAVRKTENIINYTSHIAHEYCHHIGFSDKDASNESLYRNVVPYAIGDIVCRMLNKRFEKNCDCDE